jgi:hypothetical protein
VAQVFISYNKRDRALVERVRDALADAELSVWWDDDVTPREHWDRTLEREIGVADHVLVLWTRNSVESDWVRIEANYGRNNGKLVQARFDHSAIPIAFTLTQYVDLSWEAPEASADWPKLLEWLGKASPQRAARPQPPLAPTPAPASPAEPPPMPAYSGPTFWFVALAWLLVFASGFGLVNGITNFGEIGDDSRPGYGVSDFVECLILICQTVGLIGFLGAAFLKRWAWKLQALFVGSGMVLLTVARFSVAEVLTVALLGGLLLLLPYHGIRKGWMS